MTLKSLGPALTNTAAYWHSKSTGWLSALLSLPSNTHTHTVETENVWRFEHCHWAFSGWIITLGLSEQSASCPKSCQHPTYPKPSATVPCAYGIFAVFPTHFSWHTLLQLLEWHATFFFFSSGKHKNIVCTTVQKIILSSGAGAVQSKQNFLIKDLVIMERAVWGNCYQSD